MNPPDRSRVTFRFRPGRPVPFVDVRGNLIHWAYIQPMTPDADGWREASFRVGPGVYSYKFRMADDTWLLDPENPRTAAWQGDRNSVLTVGGTPEPLLHAPSRPWIAVEDDGRVRIRAGLRKGSSLPVRLRWDDGHGPREVVLDVETAEDEHLLLSACIPACGEWIAYGFLLPDGRFIGPEPGRWFQVELAPFRPRTPAWWREAVLYTVFVDRFRRPGGDWLPPLAGAREDAPAGGSLPGVVEALPFLADLGITVLHLTPIVVGRSSHRYDTVDPRVVDPALGGEEAFNGLLRRAHDVGIRVILDINVTHVHRDFFAFREIRREGPASPYWDWFLCERFPFAEGLDPGYRHYQKERWDEPLLNLDHPEVRDFLVGTAAHWCLRGADGFRIDAAADIPIGLVRRIAATVHELRPEAVVFGEVIPDNGFRWIDAGLDAVTDFVAQQAMYDWLWRRRIGASGSRTRLARRDFLRGGPGWTGIGFLGTHDQPRLLTLTGEPAVARLATLLLLTRPEVPALYYGDEIGLTGGEPDRAFEDAWPDRARMPWDPGEWDLETLDLASEAIRVRKSSPALTRGDTEFLDLEPGPGEEATDDVLAFRRTAGEDIVEVVLNGGPRPQVRRIANDAPSGVEVLMAHGDAAVDGENRTIRLGPWSGIVIRRGLSAETARFWTEMLAAGERRIAEAFRAGSTEVAALPRRIYLTVTERCNLRCRHCINHSPERTVERIARTAQPWLLSRLAPAFEAADYVGFTHGGESLVAPELWDVLGAIRSARKARGRTDIHLLSNGMLLDLDTFVRLAEAGVTSLGVSLDGATPETNDAIRLGGSFDRVTANLAAAARVRQTRGIDIRIGVSMTVGVSNVSELPAMGQLCLDLGVDWLKIEEMFPANPFGRREFLDPREPRVVAGMARLREVVAGSKLVLVDHLDPPVGCRCQIAANPGAWAFRDADDFANRTMFHPCRMAWEQAAVDPDGTVHAVDYHHPALGNLLDAPMPDLWNNARAAAIRREALTRIPAGLRERCPA